MADLDHRIEWLASWIVMVVRNLSVAKKLAGEFGPPGMGDDGGQNFIPL